MTTPSQITFSWAGAEEGARIGLMLAIPAAVFGLAYGVFARQSGLTLSEAMLMSVTVFAGASQFAVTGLYAQAAPFAAIIIAAFAINARFFLQGASLQPYMGHLPKRQVYPSLFLLADANWAYTLRACKTGRADVAMLPTAGAIMGGLWIAATGVGHVMGAAIADPRVYGLDFILVAFFTAMLPATWTGRTDIAGWLVAGAAALGMTKLGHPEWGVAAGALAGSLTGGLIRVRQH